MLQNCLLTIILFGLVSCAGMFHRRSFIDKMEQPEAFFNPGEDFPVVPGDSGQAHRSGEEITGRTPLNPKEQERLVFRRMLNSELARLEAKLSPVERADFRKHTPYLETESEKIYYLKLPYHKRVDYLSSRRLASGAAYEDYGRSGFHRKPASVLDRELFLGMGKQAVIQSWGQPHKVDIAGNPRHENERWSFYSNGRVKQVFFEAGRVHGWSIE